jgi:hypothetical protein
MNPDFDNRGSKYSFLPSSTLARLMSFTGSMGMIGSCATTEPEMARTIASLSNDLPEILNISASFLVV